LFIPQIGKSEGKRSLFTPQGIDSKELIPPAYALAGLYNNPIPTWFLVPLALRLF
jgi:hypothetical protein